MEIPQAMSLDTTHDISLIDYHIKDLKTFCEILKKAISGAFPNKGKPRYREAHVLLLSWEGDNLGTISEVTELRNVFSNIYNFQTEEWKIPSGKSHYSLTMKIGKFITDYEKADSLLIVYYGGHGAMNDNRQCVWSW